MKHYLIHTAVILAACAISAAVTYQNGIYLIAIPVAAAIGAAGLITNKAAKNG